MASETTRPVAALARVLRDAPVTVVPRQNPKSDGVSVTIEGPASKARLRLVWVGEGWPSDVGRVLASAPDPWPRDLVVVASQFSPGALRQLRARDANWVDETEEARIIGPSGVFVIHHERSDVRRRSDDRAFGWSASAVAIAEVLLARHSEQITNTVLAQLTDFSPPQISRTLSQFDRQGWTRKIGRERGPGAARVLDGPDALLRDWSTHLAAEQRQALQAHAILKDPFKFLRSTLAPALNGVGNWALSGWAGLELEAPFATQVPTLHVYIPSSAFDDGQAEGVLRRARLRSVDEGARVILWPAEPTTLRLKQVAERRRLPVVSAPRLYADLLKIGGRGVDAAEHVRETLLDL